MNWGIARFCVVTVMFTSTAVEIKQNGLKSEYDASMTFSGLHIFSPFRVDWWTPDTQNNNYFYCVYIFTIYNTAYAYNVLIAK